MAKQSAVRRYLTAFDTGRLPQVFADVVVLGSGVAALRAAIEIAPHLRVALLTKSGLTESNSYYAQGGIAAAVDESDSIASHVADTLKTGCGLSDVSVVQHVVEAAPECIRELVDWGAGFDQSGGHMSVGREGGHSAPRILHARGDETGKEITSTLLARAIRNEAIDIYENTFAVDLLTVDGAVVGVLAWNLKHGLLVVRARRTVLASGGLGCIYRETTNPEVATGDGLAMAYRAGAVLADLEFVQFHPTTLYIAGASRHLISETVRGEGGRLVDKAGRAFMQDYDPMADLAPRDVVSRAILTHMRRTGAAYVYLDLTGFGPGVRERFPGIAAACRHFDIDVARDWIPVRPSAHYMIGGDVDIELGACGGDAGEPPADALAQARQVQVHVGGTGPLHVVEDGPADNVARGEVAHGMVLGHERAAALVDEASALAADGLGDEVPARPGDVQRGRMELDELQVRQGRPGPVGHGQAVAGGHGGVRRLAIDAPQAAAGQDRPAGPDDKHPVGGVPGQDADDRSVDGQQVDGEGVLVDIDGLMPDGAGQEGGGDFLAGLIAAGVEDARGGVAALAADADVAVRPVERRTPIDELADAVGGGLHHPPHHRRVRQAAARAERIGDVARDRVGLVDGGGDAALGVVTVRLRQAALRQQRHPQRRRHLDGRPQRRHPAAQDHHVRKDLGQPARVERRQVPPHRCIVWHASLPEKGQ